MSGSTWRRVQVTGMMGLALVLGACRKDAPARIEPPVVRTAAAAASDSSGDLVLSGALEADQSVAVTFRTLGTVERVLADEGQVVRQGQTLAVLDAASLRDQLASVQAKARQADDAYDRLAPMHKNGTVPEVKWVEVETGRDQAHSMVSMARRNLQDAVLKAPLSGIIAKRSAEPGEQAQPGLAAFTIVQTGTMLAVVPVAERDVVRLKAGMSARVSVTAAGKTLTGRIREIGVEADPLTRTYKVKIAIPNSDGALRVGMVSDVRLRVSGGRPAVMVPAASVLTDADGKCFVWVTEGDIVRRRLVSVTGFLKEGIALDSGVAAGESVVVSGTPMLADGLHVRIGK